MLRALLNSSVRRLREFRQEYGQGELANYCSATGEKVTSRDYIFELAAAERPERSWLTQPSAPFCSPRRGGIPWPKDARRRAMRWDSQFSSPLPINLMGQPWQSSNARRQRAVHDVARIALGIEVQQAQLVAQFVADHRQQINVVRGHHLAERPAVTGGVAIDIDGVAALFAEHPA